METPLVVLQQAAGMRLVDQDGNESTLELLPPLSEAEMAELETALGPLPLEVRELLAFSRGFEGVLESLDLYGLRDYFELEEVFPCGHPIAHDGFGNYWVVDVHPQTGGWEGIFFACHDPPVIVFQTDSLAEFLAEVIRFGNPPWESTIDDVHERHAVRIWQDNPGAMGREACLRSGDEALAAFAADLDEGFEVIDLRGAKCGDGFSWGRHGPRTLVRRHGMERLFAVKNPRAGAPSLWSRLFGRSPNR